MAWQLLIINTKLNSLVHITAVFLSFHSWIRFVSQMDSVCFTDVKCKEERVKMAELRQIRYSICQAFNAVTGKLQNCLGNEKDQ